MKMPKFAKNQTVLYHDRRLNVYRKAKVVDIDQQVQPPSYTIAFINKNNRVNTATRITEEDRLASWTSSGRSTEQRLSHLEKRLGEYYIHLRLLKRTVNKMERKL
jgi:chromosome segregation ATPase